MCSKAPWGITRMRPGSTPTRCSSSRAPWRVWTTTASISRATSTDAAPAQHVVDGHHPRALGWQQEPVGRAQPLVVGHVGVGQAPAEAQHAGGVLERFGHAPPPPGLQARPRGQWIEQLGELVVALLRQRTVEKPRRDQLHGRPSAGQRGGQRVVVRGHVARRIDQLHLHEADILGLWSSAPQYPSRSGGHNPPDGARDARRCGASAPLSGLSAGFCAEHRRLLRR